MGTLTNKVVIITGSSMGIGKVMARSMAEQGAKIVLNGRNQTRLDATFEELKKEFPSVIAIQGDVSNVEDCERLMKEAIAAFGQIDVLVNNAGISMEGTIEDLHPDVFKKVIEVNILGSVYPTQCALPALRKSKGHVIFMGSAAGIRGIPNYGAYSASKMALTAIVESMKIELEGTDVHVGLAYVGFTENDPDKTIFDAKGQVIPQPKRSNIKAEPPQAVAKRIIAMIENRRFKQVFTPLGKLNAVMNKWAPGLVGRILSRNYQKQQSEKSA